MIKPDHTYWIVKGLAKKMKDTTMLIALRVVVTVTAVVAPVVVAPVVLTRVKTTWIPR
jgi:hypothetical protein